jgi:peptidyl-dipeptidase Dcp
LERWLSTDRVINQFLVHNKTGDPMPKELVDKIKKASTFNQGFETTEYLGLCNYGYEISFNRSIKHRC